LVERSHGKAEVPSSNLGDGSTRTTIKICSFCFMDIQILSQKFCDYSTYIKGYTKDTIKGYKFVVKFFCQIEKVQEIEEVNDDNIRHFFYHGRTERNWSSATFITYHKSLIVFFRWCVTEKYLEKNPIDDIETPRLEKKLPSKLTKQDAMKLLEFVYNYPYSNNFVRCRNYAMFATFIFAGLRRQELLNLKFTDIDIENFSIFVRQGKGSKDRVIPICHTLAEIYKKYLSQRKSQNKTCPEFFASYNRNMGFTEHGLKHLVEDFKKESGIKFGVHKLRHTFATLMLEGGCDIYSLSKMMGHSDIKTTTIYLAASAEHLRSQIVKHPLNNI
jgi:site-specific recombinase XerD